MLKFRHNLVLIFLLTGILTASGQMTKIMGTVTDSLSKEPLPFVNIILKGTTIGTQSGFDGKFAIETRSYSDSLVASFLGYKRVAARVQKGKFQVIDIELVPSNYLLQAVVILPGENPAEVILKKIIERKDSNDREKYPAYQYESYTKIQFDANNISDKFKNRAIFKPFKFIFDYMDTSTVNGKAYLPIFLSESLSDVYFRGSPRSRKEVIKATQISGIRNQSISQLLGDVVQSLYIYDNYISIFDKNFVSPVANFGLLYYKYYLVDSSYIGNQYCYKIMFKPRRKQELTFTGEFWVHDSTWAVRSVDMKMAEDANINFLNGVVVTQDYERVDNRYWMMTRETMLADFNLVEDAKTTLGFYGRKTATYRNFVFNKLKDDAFYASPENVSIEEDAEDRGRDYWAEARHDSLTKDEKTIYYMIDTLKSLPAFKDIVEIIKMITTGYYVRGNFEWGPYMSIISFNPLEGTRFRLGGRTSNDFSKKVMISAYGAYGTLDQQLKYSAGVVHMLNKSPRRLWGASYKYDIEQLGQSQNAFREDFLLASLFRRNPPDKLSLVEEYKGFYEHEWFTGFMNRLNLDHRKIFSVGNTKFLVKDPLIDSSYIEQASIVTSEVGVDLRFAYKERFVMGEFERVSVGAKYPIVEIQYKYGIPDLFHSDYTFHRLQLGISHWFNVGPFGWSKYIIEAGKIWGDIPFPLLKLHEGNETFSLDEYAYNTMNYYEFVSDQYLSAYYTHHFDGLFLNRIPLLRKLKWREVGYAKVLIGEIGDIAKYEKFARFPAGLSGLSKPYIEMGAGVENIFKILRFDAIWRLSYLDHPNITKFGLRATLWFTF